LKTSSQFKGSLLLATFIVYIAVVAGLTIVPTQLGRFRSADPDHINLMPLQYSFRCFELARKRHPDLMGFCVRNTFGNILLFAPLGILLPLVTRRFQSLKSVLLLGFCASLMIEAIQLMLRFVGSPRAVDIDDVIFNTLGTCVGFFIYRSAAKGEHAQTDKIGDAR
jgi:glycopeptide antibiotics resistance protein